MHILLIDDDSFLRKLLRLALEKMGHSVTEAKNGKEGLDLFLKGSPDLVVTDLIMPEKEGLETIRDLKRHRPDIKIIAMSGGSRSAPSDNLKIAKYLGAALVLEKPFGNDELANAVSKLAAPAGIAEPRPEARA